jgi:hypothetical protein
MPAKAITVLIASLMLTWLTITLCAVAPDLWAWIVALTVYAVVTGVVLASPEAAKKTEPEKVTNTNTK